MRLLTIAVLMISAGLMAGCQKKPDGRVRPPVDELSDGGRGLQGKDVISASDKMAADLLALPALNASKNQWTIVIDRVENLSVSQRQNFDVFLLRLRSKLIQQGAGRVQLIENLKKFRDLRAAELETAPNVGSVQPDYFLSATLSELPNKDTSYFNVDFTLTKVDRTIVWGNMYEVTANR